MRAQSKIPGLVVVNPALVSRALSSIERVLTGLPGLTCWVEPSGLQASGQMLERVTGGVFEPCCTQATVDAGTAVPWALSTFPNGMPAIQWGAPGSKFYVPSDALQMNADEFTTIDVIRGPAAASRSQELRGMPASSGSTVSMRLGLTNTRILTLWDGSTTARAAFNSPSLYCDPAPAAVVMTTFDLENGVQLFVNDVLVARNAADKRPLTRLRWHYGGASSSYGTTTTAFSGLMGHSLTFNRSLARSRNAAIRSAVAAALLPAYGISA